MKHANALSRSALARNALAGYALSLAISLVVMSLAYAAYVYVDSGGLYQYAKRPTRGWTGAIHQADALLGHGTIPGGQGAEVFPVGPPVPARISSLGNRIPLQSKDEIPPDAPRLLTLGCSFTYGAACVAEDTFTHRAALQLDAVPLNHGVCGYGLAQMLLLAEEMIPRRKPHVVVAQYAFWLLDRSQGYAPTYYLELPAPYFHQEPGGDVAVARPYYLMSRMFALDKDAWAQSPEGFNDRLRFLVDFALPVRMQYDAARLQLAWRRLTGQVPPPLTDRMTMLRHGYEALAELCRANDAQLYILALDEIALTEDALHVRMEKDWLRERFGARFVETAPVLRQHLPPGADPVRHYGHVRQGELVDNHPNAQAHALYAGVLSRAISTSQTGQTAAQP